MRAEHNLRWERGSGPGQLNQPLDDESGNYFFGARYYSPSLGRFLSSDPAVGDPYDAQQLHRYAYARNNPLVQTDSGGQFLFFLIGLIADLIFALIVVAVYVALIAVFVVAYLFVWAAYTLVTNVETILIGALINRASTWIFPDHTIAHNVFSFIGLFIASGVYAYVGLVLALLCLATGSNVIVRHGVILLGSTAAPGTARNRAYGGIVGAFIVWLGNATGFGTGGFTVGPFIFYGAPLTEEEEAHEFRHVRQYQWLGSSFLIFDAAFIAVEFLATWDPYNAYANSVFEADAYAQQNRMQSAQQPLTASDAPSDPTAGAVTNQWGQLELSRHDFCRLGYCP